MVKEAPDRAKADLKTHIIAPKTRLQSMQDGAPLEGQKGQQTRQGERGSPPSDFRAERHI